MSHVDPVTPVPPLVVVRLFEVVADLANELPPTAWTHPDITRAAEDLADALGAITGR